MNIYDATERSQHTLTVAAGGEKLNIFTCLYPIARATGTENGSREAVADGVTYRAESRDNGATLNFRLTAQAEGKRKRILGAWSCSNMPCFDTGLICQGILENRAEATEKYNRFKGQD